MLSEKITDLRRRFGWSQEDLAAQLDVSRQSVSKWESGASQPELDKVLAMSRIFGVSTDYLLKDELDDLGPAPRAPQVEIPEAPAGCAVACGLEAEEAGETPRESAVSQVNAQGERILTLAEANKYLENRRQGAGSIALGVALCVACAAPLMFMLGMASHVYYRWEGLFIGLGLMLLLGMIAGGVYLFIITGMRMAKYRYIDEAPFELPYAMKESAEHQRVSFRPDFSHNIAVGVALCVLSPAPVCAAGIMGLSSFFMLSAVGVLLAMIGAGTFMFVQSGIIMNSFTRLLQEGDYSLARKRRRYAFRKIANRLTEKAGETVDRLINS